MSDLQGKKILVIDDDPDLLQLMARLFARTEAQVYTDFSGQEGLRQFYAHQPDLVLLDVMMPELDGWSVCQRIRQVSNVPLIILSALVRDKDVVRGLDCGADDYVSKPFSPNVLLARARTALRRGTSPHTESLAYADDHLTIDGDKRRVLVCGEPIRLSATEYRLLAFLLQHAGQVLTFQKILGNVWGEGCQDCIEYVHVYICHLRQKLERDPKQPKYLLSERGVGYRFEKQASCPKQPSGVNIAFTGCKLELE